MPVTMGVRKAAPRLALLALALLSGCASDQVDFDLFPLYRNRQQEHSGEFSILYPLSDFQWDENGSLSWTVPFHVHWIRGENEELTMIPALPIYYHRRALDLESTHLFPLFSRTRSGGRTETTLLLLLADWSRYAGEEGLQSFSLFPLFQWEKKGAGTRLSFLRALEISPTGPAVSLLDVDRSGLHLGAGEDRQALSIDVASVLGRLVNLFHYDDDGSHTDVRLLTLFANEDWSLFQSRRPHRGAPGAETSRTVLFPFYWDIRNDANTRTRIVWPFYGTTRRDGRAVVRYILFPLLRLSDDPDAKTSGFDFLWPLIGHQKITDRTHGWFWPLFDYRGFKNGYQWRVVLNMFGYGRQGERSRMWLFWIPWDFSDTGGESHGTSSARPVTSEP